MKAIRYERLVVAPLVVLLAGLALGFASIIVYATAGYGRPMLLLWAAAVLVLGVHFWSKSEALPRIKTADFALAGGLMLLFAPLYMVQIYRWPPQVGYDEITIMSVAQRYSSASNVDIFGSSDYWGRPALQFGAWGDLGKLIGGIDLFHMRLLHALFGLIVIAVSYALFRQLLPRGWSVFAACVTGVSHSMIIISRLAMRENTSVLIEVAAFALLLRGLRRDHAFSTYCGGLVAGLGYYVYEPARTTFPFWLLFLVVLALLYRARFPLRRLARLGAIATAGFTLMAAPILISDSRVPAGRFSPYGFKDTLMLYPQAREVQKDWIFSDSIAAAVKQNISYGLTTFNSPVIDHGWTYINEGHGFVDPFTGVLLWIGVGAVLLGLVRRRGEPWPALLLGSFLGLWLLFAFLINKSPNYTRLLVTLPFVAYLVTEAVRMLGRLLERGLARWDPARASRSGAALAVVTLAVLAASNVAIAWDYVVKGQTKGQDIGSTGRYIASHPDEDFYLAGDDEHGQYRYFSTVLGDPEGWLIKMRLFARDARVRYAIPSGEVGAFSEQPPFGLLMTRDLWRHVAPDLAQRYPKSRVRNVTPDGRLIVIEATGTPG